MAALHPTSIDHLDDDMFGAEKQVFEKLKALSDEYHVFHSTTWNENAHDGECDFIIFHASKGFIALEVKGGAVSCRDRVWKSRDRQGVEHEIDDPIKQAKNSMYALKRFWEEKYNANLPGLFGWAVCFLDGAWDEAYSTTDLRERNVLDAAALETPGAWVEAFFKGLESAYGSRLLSPDQSKKFIEIFNRDLKVGFSIAKVIREQEERMIVVNHTQEYIAALFDGKERIAFRGAAGTGKTWLAMKKAKRLAAGGKKVLFLCYNGRLADFLKEKLEGDANIKAATYHSFALERLKDFLVREVEQSGKEKEFWALFAAMVEAGRPASHEKTKEAPAEKKEKSFAEKLHGALSLLMGLEPGQNYAAVFEGRAGSLPGAVIDAMKILCPEGPGSSSGDKGYFYREGVPLALIAMNERENTGPFFDALVIDEGQDFDENWCDSLSGIFQDFDKRTVYIFYDDNQTIFGEWKSLPVLSLIETEIKDMTYQLYDLKDNLRNTRNIHSFAVQRTELGRTAHSPLVTGLDPDETSFRDAAAAVRHVGSILKALTDVHRIANDRIAVLSNRKIESSIFQEKTAGDFKLTATGIGNKGKNIKFRTIQEFKGLESDVVILVIHEREEDKAEERHLQPELLYVGYTRAKHLLYVVRVG